MKSAPRYRRLRSLVVVVDPIAQFPADAAEASRRRRARVGVVLIVAGVVVAAVAVVLAIRFFPDVGSYPRASGDRVPVELSAGVWTVFAERGLQPPRSIEGPGGTPVALNPISSRQTYTIGGRSGAAVGSITAPVDGTYLVSTAPGETIAFGQNFGRRLAGAIVSGVLGGLLAVGCLVAGLITLITARRRPAPAW